MYAEQLKAFENVENLAGKAWQHAVNLDFIEKTNIKDCSLHCFHLWAFWYIYSAWAVVKKQSRITKVFRGKTSHV